MSTTFQPTPPSPTVNKEEEEDDEEDLNEEEAELKTRLRHCHEKQSFTGEKK